jgi:hypothetical protein
MTMGHLFSACTRIFFAGHCREGSRPAIVTAVLILPGRSGLTARTPCYRPSQKLLERELAEQVISLIGHPISDGKEYASDASPCRAVYEYGDHDGRRHHAADDSPRQQPAPT